MVYRQKHLLVGTDKSVTGSYELGRMLAELLLAELPESRARVARAPDRRRIASLLASGQLDIALLPFAQARALMAGEGAFADYGPLELRALFEIDGFVLVCRPDFPPDHAALVTEALRHALDAGAATTPASGIPVHEGSAAPPD